MNLLLIKIKFDAKFDGVVELEACGEAYGLLNTQVRIMCLWLMVSIGDNCHRSAMFWTHAETDATVKSFTFNI